MIKNLKFSVITVISIFVLLSCCDIAYINHIYDMSSMLFVFRIIFIFILSINLIARKKINNLSKVFILINLLFVIFFGRSLIRTTDVGIYVLRTLSKPYLIVLFIQNYFEDSNKIKKILSVWKKVLVLLCFIDFITIIIFPNGMYKDKNYVLNWFLGYKTARLVYSWPLLLITSYLEFSEKEIANKNLSIFTYFCFIICIFSAFKSEATGAWTALLLYAVFVYYLKTKNKENSLFKLYRIFNVKNVILSCTIIYCLVMSIESNIHIQNIVSAVFNKSATLSNRVDIWRNCFMFFLESPIFGKGMYTTLEYISITKYYLGTNAHNLLLTILISGGIVAMIIYLVIFKLSMSRKKHIYTRQEVSLIASIIVFLIVGVISSALAFSAFAFCPFILLELERKKKGKVQ